VGSVERPADGGIYLIFDYACQVISGVPRPGDDAAAVAWVDDATFLRLEASGEIAPLLGETLREWGVLPLRG
jgi:8-oxo-dGTP diphosphatase